MSFKNKLFELYFWSIWWEVKRTIIASPNRSRIEPLSYQHQWHSGKYIQRGATASQCTLDGLPCLLAGGGGGCSCCPRRIVAAVCRLDGRQICIVCRYFSIYKVHCPMCSYLYGVTYQPAKQPPRTNERTNERVAAAAQRGGRQAGRHEKQSYRHTVP